MHRIAPLCSFALLFGIACNQDGNSSTGAVDSQVETVTGWKALYGGLEREGSSIPRKGLSNPTLKAALGYAVEPLGEAASYGGFSFVRGPVSWFGGPNDPWIGQTETGAITGEVLRLLNDPVNPTPEDLASRPEDYYFCAMRWNYSPNGKSWWAQQRILVLNPKTGAAIVVRPVDWGPHVKAGRILDLSYQAIQDLGLKTDEDALVAFAAPGAPLGVAAP